MTGEPAAVEAAIAGATSGPGFGFVGARLVNVLAVNLALDAADRTGTPLRTPDSPWRDKPHAFADRKAGRAST